MPWGLLILLLVGALVLWAAVVLHTAWLLRHPPRRTYAWAVSRGVPGDPGEMAPALTFTSWTFRSRGLELPVWDVVGAKTDGPTVVITHGWADARVVMLERVRHVAATASRVIVWEQAGHGEAPGLSSLGVGEVDDLCVLVGVLQGERAGNARDGASRLVLHGFSLGAGVSIAAAARVGTRVAAVVAEAPYRLPMTPARNVLRLRGLPYRLTLGPAMMLTGLRIGAGGLWATSRDPGGFDRVKHAAKLDRATALVVLHGTEDAVCPVEDGEAIAAATPGGMIVRVEGGGHVDLWSTEAGAEACVEAFEQAVADQGARRTA